MRSGTYDLEAIKDNLTVLDVLEAADIEISAEEEAKCAIPCPLHGGEDPNFKWCANGKRFQCFSHCGGGDVIDFIMKLKDLSFSSAVGVAARLAGVAPGPPADPDLVRQRAEQRKRKADEAARQKALKQDERAKAAMEFWFSLNTDWNKNVDAGLAYLQTRDIAPLVTHMGDRFWVMKFCADGSICTPIYSFDRTEDGTNVIVNVATRRVTGNPKVLVLKGATTHGTFGRSSLLRHRDRIVLVEGVVDYLTALLTFQHEYLLGTAPYRGNHMVLGGHSASSLPAIVRTLGEDLKLGACFRSLPLLLVTHQDGLGGAGASAEAKVMAEAKRLNIAVSRFDLGAHKDLNDWYRANVRFDSTAPPEPCRVLRI